MICLLGLISTLTPTPGVTVQNDLVHPSGLNFVNDKISQSFVKNMTLIRTVFHKISPVFDGF